MSAYTGINIIAALFVLGFSYIVMGHAMATIEGIIVPIVAGMGLSENSLFILSGINYAFESIPILASIGTFIALQAWNAHRS